MYEMWEVVWVAKEETPLSIVWALCLQCMFGEGEVIPYSCVSYVLTVS